MATFKTGYSFDSRKLTKDIKEGKFKDKEPAKYIFETNQRGRKVKKINPRWTAWSKKQKNKTNKTESKTTQTKNTPTFKQSIKAGEELNKTVNKASDKKPKNNKLKIKPTTEGGPVKDGVKYARSKGDDLAGYRRGPGTKLGKDTRITKKLKKAGFTEDRLARLRKKHADWKAKRKKKKTS